MVEAMYNSLRNDRDLMAVAQRIAGDKWEDVVQEIGIVLCNKSEPELEKIQPYFRFWCIRTMTNMMSRTGAIGSKETMIDRNIDVALLLDGLHDHGILEDVFSLGSDTLLSFRPRLDGDIVRLLEALHDHLVGDFFPADQGPHHAVRHAPSNADHAILVGV